MLLRRRLLQEVRSFIHCTPLPYNAFYIGMLIARMNLCFPPRIYNVDIAFDSIRKVADADFPTRWAHFRILGFEGILEHAEPATADDPAPQKRIESAVALVLGNIHAA